MKKLFNKAFYLCEKLANLPLVGRYFADIPLLCSMVSDYKTGKYKEIPLATIITALVAIIYFVSPIDIIPDAIPLLGALDDATLIGLVLEALSNDLHSYNLWKTNTSATEIKNNQS